MMSRKFGLITLFVGLTVISTIRAEVPLRSDAEKVRAIKALQLVKEFAKKEEGFLGFETLRDIGMIDRLSEAETDSYVPIVEVLIYHMNSDKPNELAVASAMSLRSILDQNLPAGTDFPALRLHQILMREWTNKVLLNKALRNDTRIKKLLATESK